MANRTVLVGMAATFVGLTALLVVAGLAVNPILLALAVPFGFVAYLLWYHATGRLQDRARREAESIGPTERERARQRARATENRRDAYRTAGATAGSTRAGTTDGRAGGRARAGGGGDPRNRAPPSNAMSEREAYETLGLDPSADAETVRSTYRDRAKRLHPDADGGDEESFKRLNRAYEVLTE